jgi:TonB dependent receptor
LTADLNGVYLFDDVQQTDSNGGAFATIGPADVIPSRAQNATITWSHTISNNVLNQFRFGYERRVANFVSPDAVGVVGIVTFVDPLGTGLGASPAIPQFFTENQFQYKDDIAITHGKHNLKTGFEYRRTRNGSSFFNDRYGSAFGWSVEDLVTDFAFTDQLDNQFAGGPTLGACALCGASVDPRTGTLPDYYRGYRANEFGVYGQDDFRLSQKLTLNLGLRWEYFGPPSNFQPNLDSNFYFGPATTPIVTTSNNPFFPVNNPFYARLATGSFQTRHPIWNQDTNNFGPRVGFAYDVRGNGKLVVRAGFGVMYDRIYNNLFENIRFNPPFFADINFGLFGGNGAPAGALATPGFYATPFVANTNGSLISPALFPNGLPKASPRHMDQNLVIPYYQQMHFGVQDELKKDMILELNYIGTLGRKLTGILNNNTFDGRTVGHGFPSTRPNTAIGSDNFRTNAFGSNYSALQATVRKRYSIGLQFNASYTYSKALDELSDAFRAKALGALNACSVMDCANVHLNYGPADFDIRHRFVASYNYDLPFSRGSRWLGGWQVNGIFSWQSGVPIPIFDLGNDSNHDGLFGSDRPEYATGFNGLNVTTGQSAGIQFLNPAGFITTTCPANVNMGLWCNSPMHRNDVYGPNYVNLDFGLGKSFKITEGSKLTFFANFFNIFNHPQFATPQGNFSDPKFGQSENTVGLGTSGGDGHRIGQLALRFDF